MQTALISFPLVIAIMTPLAAVRLNIAGSWRFGHVDAQRLVGGVISIDDNSPTINALLCPCMSNFVRAVGRFESTVRASCYQSLSAQN